MTTFRLRGDPNEVHVRVKLEKHPVIEAFHRSFGIEHEAARNILTESVLDAMEMLGSKYVTKMTQVVGRLTQIRETIHFVYEKVLSGSGEPVDPQALRQAFDQLHAATKELADPHTWAEGEGKQTEPLPANPTMEYPGARPGLGEKPTRAPRKGEPIRGRAGQTWDVQTKHTGDITLEMDADGLYWKFPELTEGVVLHFPEYGYRVWKEPGTGAIVEELVVGASTTPARKFTRGEDVIFSAADMGEAYRKAGTQRAHGAGSPGLGFDASYGIAHAVERINGWLESNGVEQWVRNLRDNAEPGVEYVWTTSTQKRGQKLAQRQYTISAIADGAVHELYSFEVSVPEGPPSREVPVDFDIVGVTPAADQYGAPYTKKSLAAAEAAGSDASAPVPERLEPPEVVSEALGRRRRSTGERSHPAVEVTGARIEKLTERLHGQILELAVASGDLAWNQAIEDVTNAVQDLDTKIKTTAPDPGRLAQIDAAIIAFNRRARYATPADLQAFARTLRNLTRRR